MIIMIQMYQSLFWYWYSSTGQTDSPILFCVSTHVNIHFVNWIFMTKTHTFQEKCKNSPRQALLRHLKENTQTQTSFIGGVCEQPCQTSVYHLKFPEAQTSRRRLHLFSRWKMSLKQQRSTVYAFKVRINVSDLRGQITVKVTSSCRRWCVLTKPIISTVFYSRSAESRS